MLSARSDARSIRLIGTTTRGTVGCTRTGAVTAISRLILDRSVMAIDRVQHPDQRPAVIAMTIHAPTCELADTERRERRRRWPTAPAPLMTALGSQPRLAVAQPLADHACLRQRERDEDADGVERDQIR